MGHVWGTYLIENVQAGLRKVSKLEIYATCIRAFRIADSESGGCCVGKFLPKEEECLACLFVCLKICETMARGEDPATRYTKNSHTDRLWRSSAKTRGNTREGRVTQQRLAGL